MGRRRTVSFLHASKGGWFEDLCHLLNAIPGLWICQVSYASAVKVCCEQVRKGERETRIKYILLLPYLFIKIKL